MEKKIYEDEVELKKDLSKLGFYYGELGTNSEFVIIIRDNKSFAPIVRFVVTSPIEGVRKLGELMQQIRLPIEDVDIQISIVYDLTKGNIHLFKNYTCLSPYLYYKKKEINGTEVIQSKEQSEVEENTEEKTE